MSETIDTGFDDVIAGEVWVEPSAPGVETTLAPLPTAQEVPEAPAADANSVTVTENPPEPELTATVSPAQIQAMKTLLQVPDLSPPQLAELARDVAMDIKERHVVLSKFKLKTQHYEFLETYNEFYKNALHAACIDWHAPLSTQERIKIEAAAILEDSLIGLGVRMQNKGEGLPGVVEVAKLFAKVAGVGERETGGGTPGERFVINIDLGGDQKTSISVTPVAPQLADAGQPGALSADTKI